MGSATRGPARGNPARGNPDSADSAPADSASAAAAPSVAAIGIVHGEVVHARLRPVRNVFRYAAFCLRLPLSRLQDLDACGIRHNRRGLVSLQDADHGARDGSSLLPWISALLADAGIAAGGEIVLYTFPRILGYVFNPVSFWVCHDPGGAVRAVLCEVSNTFGEHHNYLLAHPDGRPLLSGQTLCATKVFHVSPFCRVQGHYRFRFHFGPGRWLARIDYYDVADEDGTADRAEAGATADGAAEASANPDAEGAAAPLLQTRISGPLAALGPGAAGTLLWRYRLYTLGVIARIHWQALVLWRKGLPLIAKPAPPTLTTTR